MSGPLDFQTHETKRLAAQITRALWPELEQGAIGNLARRLEEVRSVLRGEASPLLSMADRDAVTAKARELDGAEWRP